MNVISAVIQDNSNVYYFDSDKFNIKIGNKIIVEIDKSLYIAEVTNINIKDYDKESEIKKIKRIATKKDIQNNAKNIKDSQNAFIMCKKLINKYKLDMNLLNASYTFDRKQLIFQFTSDNRVDFRELAKELASIYKTRIELRQIGARDKAKSIGGIGVCGMQLCCKRFLHDIDSVSINMAKNQGLALNPNKINGSCGRLLCCLKYEDCDYCEAKKGMPQIGATVKTKYGEGKVISTMICKRTYKVDIPDYGIVEIQMDNK